MAAQVSELVKPAHRPRSCNDQEHPLVCSTLETDAVDGYSQTGRHLTCGKASSISTAFATAVRTKSLLRPVRLSDLDPTEIGNGTDDEASNMLDGTLKTAWK